MQLFKYINPLSVKLFACSHQYSGNVAPVGGVGGGGGREGQGDQKVQQFQFQTSGILFFMSVHKLKGPEISRFLQCMLQFLDNLWKITT